MSLYKIPDSDVWWASISINGERIRFSTGEYDPKAAQKVHDQRKAKHHDAPKLKGKTWGKAVLEWADAQDRSDSDLQSLAKFGRHYPDRLLSSVTAESIAKALRTFIKSEGTYNRYLNRIHAVLNKSGVKVKSERKKNKTPKKRMWLTRPQYADLLRELKPHQRPMVEFALHTGLRQANVLKLQWDHVDFEHAQVWIDSNDAKGDKNIGIPLSKEAVRVLKSIQGANPFWVFTYRGQPISEIKTSFQAACIRAGVGAIREGHYEGFAWHGLRHTFATWHAQSGTPLEVLKELGGWEDMRMLEEHYAQHVKGVKATFADNLGLK
jgi:integrase